MRYEISEVIKEFRKAGIKDKKRPGYGIGFW